MIRSAGCTRSVVAWTRMFIFRRPTARVRVEPPGLVGPAPEPPATQTRTRQRRRAAPKAREPGPGITRMNLHCEGPGPDSERRTPARASESPRAGEPLASWDSPAGRTPAICPSPSRLGLGHAQTAAASGLRSGSAGSGSQAESPIPTAELRRAGREGSAEPDSEANPDR
jgi:hypothetical protein